MNSGVTAPRWLSRLVGIAVVLVVWHLLAVTLLASSRGVPTPVDVLRQLWDDRHSYPPNIKTTLHEALIGYFWGNLIAIALGLVFELIPIVEGPLLRLAIASFNIPLVAIAPILVVTLSGDGPKAALAGLAVFFTTLIATVLGLRSADATSLDLIRAYGGGTGTALRKVQLWAALPSIFAGLRIAAPAALLGAVIGEFLGANQGLGVAMINAQSSFAVARTWGIALVISALAGLLYLIASVLAHLLTPWAGQTDLGLATLLPAGTSGSVWARLARAALLFVVSIAVMIGAWYALIRGFDLNPFFAKDPEAVYRFLVTVENASEHRSTLFHSLGQTLKDAAAGYLVGMVTATLTAIVVVLSPAVEQAVMPVAIALRSVPLVALTPLIALLFGRGFWGVTVVVGLVTFFPTLVNVGVGLRSAPGLACDVVRAAGGESLMAIRKVRVPYAVPAFFASARIAAPAAIGGATLAEWLATGKGLGSLLVISYSASDFNTLWSGAVLIVAVSVGLYSLVGVIEGLVIARMRG
ncbi:MAG TPA: ABC transporter permease subunit [Thermomicrobiales bacterium]